MTALALYASLLIFIGTLFGFLDRGSDMFREPSSEPVFSSIYSWSRVQLAWWSWIILSSFGAVSLHYLRLPDIDTSTLILLGMSTGTAAISRFIDWTKQRKESDPRSQPPERKTQGFFLDIISDKDGPNFSRLQHVLFNLLFGIYYIYKVFYDLHFVPGGAENSILPSIGVNDLILLGISAAGYTVIKGLEDENGKKSPSDAKRPVKPPFNLSKQNFHRLPYFFVSLSLIVFSFWLITGLAKHKEVHEVENQKVPHQHYTTYYNQDKHELDSVSWNLSPDMVNCDKARRVDKFDADPEIPDTYNLIENYLNTGYDKGHMFNYEDAACDSIDRVECFYMSNMLPQAPAVNRGKWRSLEVKCRQWAANEKIHIICGGIGSIGTIGSGQVNIPEFTYKAVYHGGQYECWIFPNSKETKAIDVDLDKCSIKKETLNLMTGLKL